MFYLIKRDGNVIGAYEGDDNLGALPWFSRNVRAYSMDHATKHEGYSVEELEDGPDCRDVESILAAIAARVGLTMSAKFVPFSESRSRDDDRRSLNWRTKLTSARESLVTDYTQGLAWSPAYMKAMKGKPSGRGLSLFDDAAVTHEVETGRRSVMLDNASSSIGFSCTGGKPLPAPSIGEILHSLALDSDVLDYEFEDWAESYGYDSDSRKAEATYNECRDSALTLRRMVGGSVLKELQTAARYN